MLKNRLLSRFIYIVIIAGCLITMMPASPVYAWGAADRWPGKAQTHQVILKEAYKLLQLDPAWKNSGFPTIDEMLQYEGMKWQIGLTFDIIGKNEYSILGAGPDDETRTKCSAHFYNPEIEKGGGTEAAQKYYSALLDGMYGTNRTGFSIRRGGEKNKPSGGGG
jgi:hypothetical protein